MGESYSEIQWEHKGIPVNFEFVPKPLDWNEAQIKHNMNLINRILGQPEIP
jgi:hypothetical protein